MRPPCATSGRGVRLGDGPAADHFRRGHGLTPSTHGGAVTTGGTPIPPKTRQAGMPIPLKAKR